MPLERVDYSPADLNGAWRTGFGATLTGPDKAGLAGYLGVTVRTVQRWTTTAGEMRNPIPVRLTGVPLEDWPITYRTRGEVTRRLAFGGYNADPPEMPYAEFGRVVASWVDADRFARNLEQELIDPWLTAAWVSYRVERTERGLEVRVVYSTKVSPKTEKIEERNP